MHINTKTDRVDMPMIVIVMHCRLRVSMQVQRALLAAVVMCAAAQTDYKHHWAHSHTYLR